MKILVIEDDEDCLFLLEKILAHPGYDLIIAKTGEEGILQGDKEIYDLALVDISLPDKNGVDVAKYLRRVKGEYFPIIAMTGYAKEFFLAKHLEAANIFTDILLKPFHRKDLMKILHEDLF